MNHRDKAFQTKLSNAAHELGVTPQQVISMKFREIVSSYSEYHRLLDMLKTEAGISWEKLDKDFQGTGYLLNDSHSKVILVEHETGLEILSIAGSIASLVGLVGLIIQGWNSMRGRFSSRHHRHFDDNIEIRKIDNKGRLQEERVHGMLHPENISLSNINAVLVSASQTAETEMRLLAKEVKKLSDRVKALEKNTAKQTKSRKAPAKKTKVGKRINVSKRSSRKRS